MFLKEEAGLGELLLGLFGGFMLVVFALPGIAVFFYFIINAVLWINAKLFIEPLGNRTLIQILQKVHLDFWTILLLLYLMVTYFFLDLNL